MAREIEEPFKFEPNELPVTNYHYRFNGRLVTAFSGSLMPEQGFFPHISDKDVKRQVSQKWHTTHKAIGSNAPNKAFGSTGSLSSLSENGMLEDGDDDSSIHVFRPTMASFREHADMV